MEENIKALDVLPKLTEEVSERIEKVLGNRPVPLNDWRTLKPLPFRR